MEKQFPFEYTLDDGTQVTVNKTETHRYAFTLKPENGQTRQFSYDDEEAFTDEKERLLDFDQLNALRRFWLLNGEE